jgi:hypothetical protein
MRSRDIARAAKKGEYQWRTNPARGESFVLYRWRVKDLTLRSGEKHRVMNAWFPAARIYKARSGTYWMYRANLTGEFVAFPTVREAMRMAVLLTKLENHND